MKFTFIFEISFKDFGVDVKGLFMIFVDGFDGRMEGLDMVQM